MPELETSTWLQVFERYKAGERDFRGVDVADSSLADVQLHGCQFGGANMRRSDLTNCTFVECDMRFVNLAGSSIDYCRFARANLYRSRLDGATFRRSMLSDCDLADATFDFATFRKVEFARSRLDNASLVEVILDAVEFSATTVSRCSIEGGAFVRSQIEPFCENVRVIGPPYVAVDWQTISRSLRAPKLEEFLAKTKIPDIFLRYMVDSARALDLDLVFRLMRSTFISYGGPDLDFALQLRNELQRSGVKTFLFAADAIPGRRLHRVMRDGVNEFDRVVLICSRASLDRKGVRNEIEETLAREARDGGESYLIPVIRDDYLFEWNNSVASAVRDRVVADFRFPPEDIAKFDTAVRRLLAALKQD